MENEDDYYGINRLIAEEIAGVGLDDLQIPMLIYDNWYQQSRAHAITYILTTGQELEFSRRTIYTAVMYVDRILANRIQPNILAVRLVAVACLSLSAELNERSDNMPRLSEYPVGSYGINVNVIRRMRHLVRNEFDDDMDIVTPFDYINFFILRFCRIGSRREITRIRTGELLMSVLTEVRIMIKTRPSVIAAAATLLAVSRNISRVVVVMAINFLPLDESLDSDNVYFIYYSLRRLNYI